MNIVYVILRRNGTVDRVALPYPQRPKLSKHEKLLRILVPEECPLFYPDKRVKAEVWIGRQRVR